MAYTKVDLGSLPTPQILESLDFESILAEMKEAVTAAMPALGPVLALESEPASKVLQVCAVYVLLTRARVNDGAKALLLSYAQGTDLEQIGANFGVARRLIEPATDTAAAVYETDEDLRYRIQLSFEGFSVAGPTGAYEFHALSAHEDVADVFVAGASTSGMTVQSGTVDVYVLGRAEDGVPLPAALTAVTAALDAATIRPLCDTVVVRAAVAHPFVVTATLHLAAGHEAAAVLAAATAELDVYLAETRRIGATVARSGILAALHQTGVISVTLASPADDVVPAPNAVPIITATSITTTAG